MNWIHLVDITFLGLCPICWFFVLLTLFLIYIANRLVRKEKIQKGGTPS